MHLGSISCLPVPRCIRMHVFPKEYSLDCIYYRVTSYLPSRCLPGNFTSLVQRSWQCPLLYVHVVPRPHRDQPVIYHDTSRKDGPKMYFHVPPWKCITSLPLTLCPLQIRRDVTSKWPSPPVAPSPCTSEWAGVYMYGSLID